MEATHLGLNNNNPSPEPPSTPPAEPHQIEFTGQANAFFSIWIVNVFLTVLTLGIYSAWAKVRTNRYFYGHTLLNGHRFEYLATPMQILKGRIIAFIVFSIYIICTQFFPLLGLLFIFGLFFLSPLIINLGMRFAMRMTRYRNIRFSFKGSYGDALVCFVLLPIASVFTLYLLLPYVFKRIDEYLHGNIEFAGKPVTLKLKTSEYYVAAIIAYAVAMGAVIVVAIVTALAGAGFYTVLGDVENPADTAAFFIGIGVVVLYFLCFALIGAIYQALIRNHILNNANIDEVAEFGSTLNVTQYCIVMVTNALAIAFTLGLAYPWAKVRKAKLLLENTQVTFLGDPDALCDQLEQEQSAFGEEAAELFDIDISLT